MDQPKKTRTVPLRLFIQTRTKIVETLSGVRAKDEDHAEVLFANKDPSVTALTPEIHHTLRSKIKQLPEVKKRAKRS